MRWSVCQASEEADVRVHQRRTGHQAGGDGSDCDWGRVAAWKPPGRGVLLWQIAAAWKMDPNLETEVEASFTDEIDGRTRLDLIRRHLQRYGEQAKATPVFGSPGGWADTLNRFVAAATV
jgi:uncharacterized protein YndB with AHSA1/START domain